jgi:hypothetical protein
MASLTFQGLWRSLPAEDTRLPERPRTLGLRVSQLLCGLQGGGHQMILKRDDRRLYLVCRMCLRETPGWSIDGRGPRPRFP